MRRSSRVVVAVAAGLLALTGCSWSRASVAVDVDGTVVSTASVDAATAAIVEIIAQSGGQQLPPEQVRTIALQEAVLGAVIDNARAAGTLTLPQDAINALIEGNPVVKALAANPATAKMAEVEGTLAAMQSDPTLAQQFQNAETNATVTINPRYGQQWIHGTGLGVKDGSLSELVSAG